MNRIEFMEKLEEGLAGVSPEERVAALQYYREYFDDAGPEEEGAVLEELGSPEKIAADIRAESGEGESWTPPEKPAAGAPPAPDGPNLTLEPEFPTIEMPKEPEQPTTAFPPGPGEAGWTGAMPPNYTAPGQSGQAPPPSVGQYPAPYVPPARDTGGWDTSKIILAVVLVIVLSPLWGALLGVAVGVLVTLFTLLLLPIIVGLAFVAAGVAALVGGAFVTAASPATGLVALGTALLVLGLGLLLIYFGIWLLRKTVPALFRGIAKLARQALGIFKKKQPVQDAQGGMNHG